MTYSEPCLPPWFEVMEDGDKDAYLGYKQQFDVFGMVMQSMGPWARMIRPNEIAQLPLIGRLTPSKERDTIPYNILNEEYYREFLEMAIQHGEHALGLFRELRDKYKT